MQEAAGEQAADKQAGKSYCVSHIPTVHVVYSQLYARRVLERL